MAFPPRLSAFDLGIVIARLVRSTDFERVLRTRSRASSTHFAVHHMADRPSFPVKRAPTPSAAELSTGRVPTESAPVDDFSAMVLDAVWLGIVVPKRHARRAVTRSSLKRQIRAVVVDQAAALAGGLWVVRLRAPFDKAHFVSAASDELKRVARDELECLIVSASKLAGRTA